MGELMGEELDKQVRPALLGPSNGHGGQAVRSTGLLKPPFRTWISCLRMGISCTTFSPRNFYPISTFLPERGA